MNLLVLKAGCDENFHQFMTKTAHSFRPLKCQVNKYSCIKYFKCN